MPGLCLAAFECPPHSAPGGVKFLVELGQGPPKLLLITTGNIHNNELLQLFVRHEETLFRLLAQHEFIELNRNQVIVHR